MTAEELKREIKKREDILFDILEENIFEDIEENRSSVCFREMTAALSDVLCHILPGLPELIRARSKNKIKKPDAEDYAQQACIRLFEIVSKQFGRPSSETHSGFALKREVGVKPALLLLLGYPAFMGEVVIDGRKQRPHGIISQAIEKSSKAGSLRATIEDHSRKTRPCDPRPDPTKKVEIPSASYSPPDRGTGGRQIDYRRLDWRDWFPQGPDANCGDKVGAYLRQLPERVRLVFAARYLRMDVGDLRRSFGCEKDIEKLEGKTLALAVQAIAELMGISKETVRRNLRQTENGLKQQLEETAHLP